MSRQLGPYYQQPSMIFLEERIRHLEATVATLAEALQMLTHALEDGPLAAPASTSVQAAARQAHDILLTLKAPHT